MLVGFPVTVVVFLVLAPLFLPLVTFGVAPFVFAFDAALLLTFADTLVRVTGRRFEIFGFVDFAVTIIITVVALFLFRLWGLRGIAFEIIFVVVADPFALRHTFSVFTFAVFLFVGPVLVGLAIAVVVFAVTHFFGRRWDLTASPLSCLAGFYAWATASVASAGELIVDFTVAIVVLVVAGLGTWRWCVTGLELALFAAS